MRKILFSALWVVVFTYVAINSMIQNLPIRWIWVFVAIASIVNLLVDFKKLKSSKVEGKEV